MKKAIVFMILSALAFSILNVFVKRLGHFNVYQIVFFRSIGSLFFTIPFIFKNNISILGNKKLLLILRGVTGFIAMTLFFTSLKYLSMGTAVSIRYISPIFATIFAILLFKEHTKFSQWVCFAIALTGVFILKEFDNHLSSLGMFYAILSAFFTGVVFVLIRKIGNEDHPIIVVNYFMIIATVCAGILSFRSWVFPIGSEWFLLLSLGFFGYFGQLYMTKAFQTGEINQVAPLKYIEVLFTMLIGVIWLDEFYSFISLLGVTLILLGLILNYIIKNGRFN